MDAQLRARAEARLAEAAAALGLADPRPPYRDRLRHLRETHPEAFERAVTHYERAVLPAMADHDPLDAWLEYGRFLAGLTADGALTTIDATGRAHNYSAPLPPRSLVLFIPQDTSEPVFIAAQPAECTAPQRGTIDLLVNRSQG